MAASIKVTGAREIERALKELGVCPANRVVRSALTRAGTPIVQRARELVPRSTRALKKGIRTKLHRIRSGLRTIDIGSLPSRSARSGSAALARQAQQGVGTRAGEPDLTGELGRFRRLCVTGKYPHRLTFDVAIGLPCLLRSLEAKHGDLSAGPLVELARGAKGQLLRLDHGAMTDVELGAQTVADRVFPREQATFQDRIGQRTLGHGAGC
jgi:hypothetical protein